ncbi:hypothetical protein HWC92_gp32 [Flavobacterium phage vB_FspS_morran9-1]|uniref:Uncharacterized protein n=8 Tax=Caudoviricetes TaxID=2731619 RepID=A0A6B9LMR8_9CAUD|nr:hypothetical protein HWC87_gp30 [Flavobacterium phage vB_FspS_filifjonk9-1]YP_009854888.1 hypothetical protein HWC91_gp33 [Flavobacterium phage vB_FspS_lillamy9-1]YP_009854960.1 hypothetical protein HWC92_gp32 [Flavobacterium phage vB_FspS_morran9-1]QHB39134.1 hypothetical protein lillamy92_gp033 [Flavobacterium phage vB_FspS_lillamy9-2]QHB39207.1 hypothetical protein lillamy93_gp033 [Flavobacterium phage vB_FspS_lillamy9-3]QHB39280.1 hypothetical protein lillamy94_gp033 [Flavobacterium pha
MEIKRPTLEEVKQKYLNVKTISFLDYSYDNVDISEILGNCILLGNGDIYTEFETYKYTQRRVLLYESITNQYAEIISYKDETETFKGFLNIAKDFKIETPKHYDNSKGTLYKVATERGWNSYLFDIVKRLERAEKKGEFKTDLEKSINVIKLWLKENEEIN